MTNRLQQIEDAVNELRERIGQDPLPPSSDKPLRWWFGVALLLAAIGIISMIASLANAQQQAYVRTPQTVQVYVSDGGGMGSLGSGVLCGGSDDGAYRCVLTVEHVTGSEVGRPVVISVGGKQPRPRMRYTGMLCGADPRSDAALVVISGQGLESIPNAQLWLGSIDTNLTLYTEGFAGGTFMRTTGRPQRLVDRAVLQWGAPSYSGMSGGPSYVVSSLRKGHPPAFVTVTTGTDGSMSIGPYRTFVRRWIETCQPRGLRFEEVQGCVQCYPSYGAPQLYAPQQPQQPGVIEGPINEPPEAPAPEPKLTDEQIKTIVAEIVAQIPKPKDGKDGDPGPPGRDGTDAVVNMEDIISEVIKNFPPFEVTRIYVDENGKQHTVKSGTVSAGGRLTLYDGPGSEEQHREMLGLD